MSVAKISAKHVNSLIYASIISKPIFQSVFLKSIRLALIALPGRTDFVDKVHIVAELHYILSFVKP